MALRLIEALADLKSALIRCQRSAKQMGTCAQETRTMLERVQTNDPPSCVCRTREFSMA